MQKKPHRQIRSYVCRSGRKKKTQLSAWETLWPLYGLTAPAKTCLDLEGIFGRSNDKIVEIGFGDGQSLVEMALAAPERDYIGIEVYRAGIASLLSAIQKKDLSNIRVVAGDAVEVLEHQIPDHSLAAIQVFFSDPWPKVRHHKRRLIQSSFVTLAAKKLKAGGIIHLATDWQNYAEQMLWVLSESSLFQNLAGEGQFMPRPDFRPLTKYERRGLKLGHKTWDLMFERLLL